MLLDHSVYPDLADPPVSLHTPEDKADYVRRVCAAFDFGVFPEETDWELFAGWKEVFDRFPIPDSPGFHTFRLWYGWEPVEPSKRLGIPAWKASDLHEERTDPCEDWV